MTDPVFDPTPGLGEVPGWFAPIDQALFRYFLRGQADQAPGDLVELGAYLGKSAIVIGHHVAPGERFVVCDLFGAPASDGKNAQENNRSYATLTRDGFEANYRRFHGTLPEIVQGPSSEILDHVKPGSCRFVHVDASHLYLHVRGDVEAARSMLRPDGIVVFDDYRSPHTPGTAAAVWGGVFELGLRPICVTPNKFYGTWGDPVPPRQALKAWIGEQEGYGLDVQPFRDDELIRIVLPGKKKPPARVPRRSTRIAKQVLPPIAVRGLQALRRAVR